MDLVGKITCNSRDSENAKHTEILGYTHSNLFVQGGSSIASTIQQFAQSVNALTQNTYDTTVVSYDIELDSFSQ